MRTNTRPPAPRSRSQAARTDRLAITAALYGIVVAVWTALRFTPMATVRPFELADLFGWALFVPLPVLAVVALFRRRLRALVWLALPALIFAVEYAPLFAPQTTPDGAPLRVMTANLLLNNDRVDEVAAVLTDEDADIIVLHELGGPTADALTEQLGDRYPHRLLHPRTDALGMGVIARVPLTERSPPRLGRHACSCMEVVARVADRDVAIVVPHLLPPGYSLANADPELQAPSVHDLLERIEGIAEPLLVAGDLNVGDRHRFYRQLRGRLGDTHRDAGAGFGFTFPARFPVVRIDYVLHDASWATASSHTGVLPGSDHRYVTADLVFTG